MGSKPAMAYDEIAQNIPANGLSALLNVSSALASTLNLAEVLRITIESATNLLSVETGAIYTLEDSSLYLGATVPPMPPDFPDELRLASLDDHPHIKNAITTKSPVYVPDINKVALTPAEQVAVKARNLVSILYFPLLLKDKAIGVFIVGTSKGIRTFTRNELDLCTALSGQSALAISNAELYKQAQKAVVDLTRAYDTTLEGWSLALEMRDHDTDGHTNRVTDLTVALFERMGFSESELGDIRRGALLHDIGKMGIPDEILRKPAALSESEWEIMKTHPELARQFLLQIDYLKPALDIPYCHHEKWNGTGYPRGLKGEEIPLAARIFAVVDVFDALISDRPYRTAWPKEAALSYIKEHSGEHFFPDAVEEFLAMIDE